MSIGPSYSGKGLVNLVAEVETLMTGLSPSPGLDFDLPKESTYVLVLFDGLGVAQLDHPAARPFVSSLMGSLDASFPTMTSVSLATVASGLTPGQHGYTGHLTWYPEVGEVVNTLKWLTPGGVPVPYEYASLMPRPNLWERLRLAGLEPITVQPGDFQSSPLTRALYRGCRFEPAWDAADLAEATITLSAEPGRFIFTYVPFVDFAGHVFGQASQEFSDAMHLTAGLWSRLQEGVGPGVTLLGTADHGLIEVSESNKVLVRDRAFDSLRFAGDGRGVMVWGDDQLISDLVAATGGTRVPPESFLGDELGDVARSHLGEALILAPEGKVILPRGFDKRLVCYHGGLSEEELRIPLLIG